MNIADPQAVSQPQLDLTECQWWIEFLHGDSPGFIHVSGAGDWKGWAFDLDHMDDLLAYVSELDARGVSGIYLRACTLREPPRGGGRGSEHDSFYFPGFWADIDLVGPGHKTTEPLPPDAEAAKQIIQETGLPEPSLWIHSGGGLYPWWILHQPQLLDGDSLENVKLMSQQWQDVIAAAAARLGFHYGSGVGDLARVLRLPGTVNRKVPGSPQICRVIEQNGTAYTLTQLHDGLTRALDLMHRLMPEPMKMEQVEVGGPSFSNGQGLSPFDHYEKQADWDEILLPHGWRESHRFGHTRYWVRPGKNPRDGHSATTGHDPQRDRLYVFSTETPFSVGSSYTKPAAYSVLNHGGDMKAAARELKRLGYGTSYEPEPLGYFSAVGTDKTAPPKVACGDHPMTDNGAALRLTEVAGHNYRWIAEKKKWYHFTGSVWRHDLLHNLDREVKHVSDLVLEEADVCEQAGNKDRAKELRRHGFSLQNRPKVESTMAQLRTLDGMSVLSGDLDDKPQLLNLRNGTLNTVTGELLPHRSTDLLTKQMNAGFDRDATCPNWEAFVERAFPEPTMREYVQRALGYSILGESDQRAIFILNGPSGTGKSQLTRAMELVCGSYAKSAAASTFKQKKGETISNDLHDLQGARFVATSETSVGALLDEELIKRVTGNDTITSRALYENNQSWRPQCVVWMATNHMPQMNADDNAMFRRVKPIDMNVVIDENEEIGAFAEKVLIHEADGILNWLLEGVRRYREVGLREPECLKRRIELLRAENDNVAMFLADAIDEEVVIVDHTSTIGTANLLKMYQNWCENNGTTALGMRRFKLRMEQAGYSYYRGKGSSQWKGLRIGNHGAGGTIYHKVPIIA